MRCVGVVKLVLRFTVAVAMLGLVYGTGEWSEDAEDLGKIGRFYFLF